MDLLKNYDEAYVLVVGKEAWEAVQGAGVLNDEEAGVLLDGGLSK